MKILSSAVLTIVMAGGSLTVQASGVDGDEREQCRAQVAEYYGGAQDMRYVGQRTFRDGTQMKFAVHNTDATTGYSTTRLATCWLGSENHQAYSGNSKDTGEMVADINNTPASPLEDTLP